MTDIAWFAPTGGVMMVSILSHKLCVAVLIAAFALPLAFVVWRAIAGTEKLVAQDPARSRPSRGDFARAGLTDYRRLSLYQP